MRILIHGINFYPELTGIGKYTGDLADYLSSHGHYVKVVTAPPYYPYWCVQKGYSEWQYRTEKWHDIIIKRCPIYVPTKPSGIKRLAHLASFAASSAPIMLGQASWKPDIVFGVVPTLLTVFSVLFVSHISGAKSWVHIQDFELEAAFNLGLLPAKNTLLPLASQTEVALFKRFDRVSTISRRMVENLLHKGLDNDHVTLFPNWIDINMIYPLDEQNPLRYELGINANTIVVLYSGNMGHKQGLETLIESAGLLKNEPDILFILSGEGVARSELERLAQGLPNVRFLPLRPLKKLNELLNIANLHVLTQRADAADLVMPSKLTGMFASGRPVIVTAQEGTELAEVVSEVGYLIKPEDPHILAKTIIHLARNKSIRSQMGWRGREYVVNNWSREIVLNKFLFQLESL